MKDMIKTVAERHGIPEDKATAFLAELSKRAGAIYQIRPDGENWIDCSKTYYELWKGEKRIVYLAPSLHDIEAIENRVAEACAKACESDLYRGEHFAGEIRSGEWRKYK